MSYECNNCINANTSECNICSVAYDCMFEPKPKPDPKPKPIIIKYRCRSCVYGHTCVKYPIGLDRPTKCKYGANTVTWHRMVLGVEVD